MSMSLRTPLTVVEPADEEVSELGTSGASAVTPSTMDLDVIKSVWEFDRIEKRGGPDSASKTWYCCWCNSSFKGGWNATKAIVIDLIAEYPQPAESNVEILVDDELREANWERQKQQSNKNQQTIQRRK